jgi:transposase
VAEETIVESVLRSAPEVGEVLPGVTKRRDWSAEEKLRILAQSTAPGSSPTLTCRMHGISSGQLYTWRKQFRSGALTGFMPVSIAPITPVFSAPAAPVEVASEPRVPGLVEVELPSGIKLRIMGDVESDALRRILSALP